MKAQPVMAGTKAHQKLREQLQKDIDRFLEEGGVITIVEPGVQTLAPVVEILEDAFGEITRRVKNPPSNYKMFVSYDREEFLNVEDF